MHKIMNVIRSIPRRNMIIAVAILACGLTGAAWGWYSSMLAAEEMSREHARKLTQQETVLVLPPDPSVALAPSEDDVPTDLAELRIWEASARQPLPPRKAPLTAPNWKIAGVTSVGDDANVLILFDKQTTPETLKVGDLLPGDAKILQITQDDLRVVLNGQIMKLSVRKQ